MPSRRAIVVGSGPNGLAAAVTLARAGVEVTVHERAATIGGGTATHELTLPGFAHDVCSAVHPMAASGEFFTRFGLADRLELLTPEISYAHPLSPGRSAIAYRSLDRTVAALGADGIRWRRLFAPLVDHATELGRIAGTPLLPPRDIATLMRLGLRMLHQGSHAWNLGFRGDEAPALLTGVMAHDHSSFADPRIRGARSGVGDARAHGRLACCAGRQRPDR